MGLPGVMLCRWLAHDFRPRYSESAFDRRDVDGTFVHFRVRQYEGDVCTRCGESPQDDPITLNKG